MSKSRFYIGSFFENLKAVEKSKNLKPLFEQGKGLCLFGPRLLKKKKKPKRK